MSNAIIRKEIDPFTMVSNQILNSVDISLSAKGMYAYMKSKPENWNFTIRSMAKQLKEGQTAISSAVKELRICGLVSYKKQTDGTGVYFVHNSINEIEPKPENPDLGFPMLGKPKRISNTDLFNKKEVNKDMADKSADLKIAFEKFWNSGLRKIKRKDAERFFAKELKASKLDPMDFANLLSADIAKRLANQQFGFASIHPTSYLNGQRWTDEQVNDAESNKKAEQDKDRWWNSDQGIARKASELGIQSRPSESYRDLSDRIRSMLAAGYTPNAGQQDQTAPMNINDDDIPY